MAVAAVGWFVSPIFTKFINTCYEYLEDQPRWQTGMKKELERLQKNHPKIQAVVSAASQAQKIDPDSALNKWIWQLRDAIDEADDVLDDFEYMKHEDLLAKNMEKTKVSLFMSSINKFVERAFKNDPMLKRLEEVLHKLDKISAEFSTFLYLLQDTKKEQQVQHDKLQNHRETGSIPTNVLIGRGQDKKSVIQWLKKLPNEEHQSHASAIPNMYHNISLLSVVGDGGMGKTTLLQDVYQSVLIKQFELKMWVFVSTNFNFKKVIADMVESLKKTRPSSESLDVLQNSLKLEVMSKKFLLVLDDIWEEDEEQDKIKWKNVLAPLAHGGLGSKILITTRMMSAASMIAKVINKENESLIIKELDDNDCLHLLNTHAFAGVKNLNDQKKLESITEELVIKLHGSPLAAKVLGGALNSKLDERHWRNVLNNVLGQNGISSILELSYIFLPHYLQNCFAFCSIFAQDHVFDKDELVRMWIAAGFIQPSNIQGETLEDIGGSYFDNLVNKSFFDKIDRFGHEYKMHDLLHEYKMHGLLHELAKKVSSQECFRVVDDEDSERIPETIRHLSIESENLELFKKIRILKNLRTLCITYDSENQDLIDVLTKLFEESRSIRLLSIFAYAQKMKSEKIGCLKHLRYLGFEFSDDTLLPRSVSNLYHLQFLICSAWHDDLFPRDMNKLSNLRYLRSPHLKFPGIGKLKFLQELNGFKVKNETGYRFEELEHMNDLCILRIKGLENVTDVQEACNAKLCDKRKLTDLSLQWKATSHNSADLGIYARVLDNLQPHKNLKKLNIKGYKGVKPAIWMNKANNLISNLEHIELVGCLEWKNLSPFGQLPFLKSLELRDMPRTEWFDNRVDCLFPCLTELRLYNCPNLQELPYLPPKLEILEAKNIGWKTLNCCSILGPSGRFHVSGCPNISTFIMDWETIGGPGVLNDVELEDCPNLLSIGGHQEVETTENCLNLIVDELSISDASVLQMEPMRSITSVRRLTIKNNFDDGSASFPFEAERWFMQVSSSLCELHFSNLKSLQSLPSYLTSLSSLEVLYIANLEALEDWFDAGADYLFPRLTKLELHNCPNLQELPYLPPKLKKLKANNIGWKTLNFCCSILGPLGRFHISGCPNISSIHMDWEIIGGPQEPGVLNDVELRDCPNLLSIGGHQEVETTENCLNLIVDELYISDASALQMELMRSITFVRTLTIKDNDGPASFPLEAERWFLQVSSFHRELNFENLKSLQSLPSYLTSLSSLEILRLENIPLLKSLPDLPPSLRDLKLGDLENLNSLPSCLPSLSSLTKLHIIRVPQLRELPDLPPSLCDLLLENLDNLNCLPSYLPSLSSLTSLTILEVPQLQELPDLPPSLSSLYLNNLDKLNCLPSCLPSLSSLTDLWIDGVPKLRELPDLPPSLCSLILCALNNLNCLPSCLPSLSSLTNITIIKVPQLRELPDLPPSLCRLILTNLDNLNCLPSCLPSLSSLTELFIWKAPQLRELPGLPRSLKIQRIYECGYN